MRDLLAPPNLLTYVRIGLTPAIVYLTLAGACERALLFAIVAGSTDAADGFLARRFGWETRAGAYLDPIADKLLLTSLYICFAIVGLVPAWLVWMVVGRDALILLMVAAGMIFLSRRDYPPTIWGKLSTAVQIAAALVFLVKCAFSGLVPEAVAVGAVGMTAAATAWSGLHYVYGGLSWVRRPLAQR